MTALGCRNNNNSNNKLCAWRHNMPSPMQVDNMFVFIRQVAPVPACWRFKTSATSWPFDLKSGVLVTCNVGYLCANFSLPRPLCSRVRPDVRDRQTDGRPTDVRQKHRLILPPYRGGGIIILRSSAGSSWSNSLEANPFGTQLCKIRWHSLERTYLRQRLTTSIPNTVIPLEPHLHGAVNPYKSFPPSLLNLVSRFSKLERT